MEPAKFDVEITITHADELRKMNRKKFDKLVERFHFGLLDFPGVGCVCGPRVEDTEDEIEHWAQLERESKARRQQQIKEALTSVFKDPQMKEELARMVIEAGKAA